MHWRLDQAVDATASRQDEALMSVRRQELELVFELGSIDAADIARRALAALGATGRVAELYGEPIDAGRIPAVIAASGRPSFKLDCAAAGLHFGTLTAYRLHSLQVKGKSAASHCVG